MFFVLLLSSTLDMSFCAAKVNALPSAPRRRDGVGNADALHNWGSKLRQAQRPVSVAIPAPNGNDNPMNPVRKSVNETNTHSKTTDNEQLQSELCSFSIVSMLRKMQVDGGVLQVLNQLHSIHLFCISDGKWFQWRSHTPIRTGNYWRAPSRFSGSGIPKHAWPLAASINSRPKSSVSPSSDENLNVFSQLLGPSQFSNCQLSSQSFLSSKM